MITIDQDELCKSCDRDINTCEGSGCNEARDSYLEDNGLIEDTPQVFGDLKFGDTVYKIYDGSLSKRSVESVKEDSDAFRLEIEKTGWCEYNKEKSVDEKNGIYVQLRHALEAYENLMHTTIKRMMKNIIKFEKE